VALEAKAGTNTWLKMTANVGGIRLDRRLTEATQPQTKLGDMTLQSSLPASLWEFLHLEEEQAQATVQSVAVCGSRWQPSLSSTRRSPVARPVPRPASNARSPPPGRRQAST
jgi:hypothetical protein